MPGIIKIAVEGAKLIRQLTEEEIASSGMNIRYEYSPESFTGTEIDFAIEICESVMETLGATNENPIILICLQQWKCQRRTHMRIRSNISVLR